MLESPIEQPLLGDDQPSWVTLANEGQRNRSDVGATSEVTLDADRVEPSASTLAASDHQGGNLPKIVLLMRLANLCAAALLIFGSVNVLIRLTISTGDIFSLAAHFTFIRIILLSFFVDVMFSMTGGKPHERVISLKNGTRVVRCLLWNVSLLP